MGIQMFLVGGPGTHKRRANFNAVAPAWRTGYVHVVTGLIWPPFDEKSKQAAIDAVTNKHSAALRKLAPDMGSYQNEANAYEPDFQQAFWGRNYPRLLDIKRSVDPDDVFWCLSCAGSERWKERGSRLCRVGADADDDEDDDGDDDDDDDEYKRKMKDRSRSLLNESSTSTEYTGGDSPLPLPLVEDQEEI